MTTLGKTAIVASVVLLAIPAAASAGCRYNCGGGTDWGAAVGAGILGGVVGSALAPAPQQQQIIVVPAQPSPPPTVIIVPGYQTAPQRQVSLVPLISSCIGGSLVPGCLTIINNCEKAVTFTWGQGNLRGGEPVTFTAAATLPAGTTRVWTTAEIIGDSVSWAACPYGMHVINAATNRKATGTYPGADLGCR
jgi:hypothetical protein